MFGAKFALACKLLIYYRLSNALVVLHTDVHGVIGLWL